MRSLLCAFVLGLALGGAASASDQILCLPPLDDLVKARLELLAARQAIERSKEAIVLQNNKLINKLVLDRLSGTYNFGKGLAVDSTLNGNTGKTLVETSKSNSAWTISYTLPLSAITDKDVTKAKSDAEVLLLLEKQRLERRDEATKINLQYGELLEAKTKLLALCRERDTPAKDILCLPLVFQVRKVAVSLLCATNRKATGNYSEWDDVAKEYAADLKAELSCVNPE